MTSRPALLLLLVPLLVLAACGGAPATDVPTEVVAAPATTSPTTGSATTEGTAPSTTTSTTTASTTSASTTSPPSTAVPTSVVTTTAPVVPELPTGDDRRVFVLGDSALLGARETVPAALVGWDVTYDAVGSRRLPQGIEVLRSRRSEIGRVVVIQQGNNHLAGEGSFAAQIDQAMGVLEGVERVVWLTVAEKWPSRVEINAAIRAAPARWSQAVVADWATVVAAHPEYAGDLLHLTASGRVAIAELIARYVGSP